MGIGEGWKLVWSEEFDGGEINRNIWSFEEGYIRNKELQYYTSRPENAYIQDQKLVIESRKEEHKGYAYTSASLTTKNRKTFLYGRIEMRAKLPYGKGIWPAFWLLGASFEGDTDWPACGEIDIMELVGGGAGDRTLYANVHSPNANGGLDYAGANTYVLENGRFCDDYHIIGLEWNPDTIEWVVDGKVYFKADISGIPCFHKEHFLLVNTAVGGAWPGDPDEETVFPQYYHIDWIRYYKKM